MNPNLGLNPESSALFLMLIFMAWSLFWKGLSLWTAARQERRYWFIALLLLNTVGVADILFLVFVAKTINKKSVQKVFSRGKK